MASPSSFLSPPSCAMGNRNGPHGFLLDENLRANRCILCRNVVQMEPEMEPENLGGHAHGILVDENWFHPTTHTYFDPMHCLCASSGVSQYHLNGFANAYVDAGGTLQDLDLFQRSIIWPPGKNRALRRRYFEKQVVQKPAEHIKSFASDVLSGVLTCLWFCKLILLPKDMMSEHCSALELLQMVHDILFYMGDKAAEHVDLLESILVVHHKKFLQLYGARAAKIKFHLLYHIIDALRRWRKSLNCFKTERMHGEPNKIAPHCRTIGKTGTEREKAIETTSVTCLADVTQISRKKIA